MLDTPEKYGEFIMHCARIYHTADPTKPSCVIITPYSYLEKAELYNSARLEFARQVDEYLLKQPEFADSILFDNEPDGGLRATITHTTKKPTVNWPFTHGKHVIALLLDYHIAVSMTDGFGRHGFGRSGIILRVPRTDIATIDLLDFYDSLHETITLSVEPIGLSFHIDAKYFEVRLW